MDDALSSLSLWPAFMQIVDHENVPCTAIRMGVTQMRMVGGKVAMVMRDHVRIKLGPERKRRQRSHCRDQRHATEIGRAHVCTPVTNAHLVCSLMLEKTNIFPNS